MSFADPYQVKEDLRPRHLNYDTYQFQQAGYHPLTGRPRYSNRTLAVALHSAQPNSSDFGRMAHCTYGEPSANNEDTPMQVAMPPQNSAAPSSPASARFPLQQQQQLRLPSIKAIVVEPGLGTAGTHVNVVINVHPSASAPIRSFRVTFGTLDATTRVAFENRATAIEHVELLATAPLLQGPLRTGRVALLVQAIGMHENILTQAEAGAFEYVDPITLHYQQPHSPTIIQSPMTPSNPRKRYGEPLHIDRVAPGLSRQHCEPVSLDGHFSCTVCSTAIDMSPMSPISPRVMHSPHVHTNSPHFSNFTSSPTVSYSNSLSGSLPGSAGPEQGMFISDSTRLGDVSADPLRINLDPANDSDITESPLLATVPLRHPPVPAAISDASQPPLLRTSQIAASGPPASTSKSKPDVERKHFTNKAVLRIDGDLNAMALGWSPEEWAAKRRLIQFLRNQEGNIIRATFHPIRPIDYRQNSIVVSCIFREEKNECYVTSVDAIYLLEAMVGTRFTVEEKNRIRRNLEGFKPITVSKSKADSEAFFKLIMGFPNPKPRNIEKDVKVFPWKILGGALEKIIGKYSAAYSADGTDASSSPLTSHSPVESRPVSRKGSKENMMMIDAPKLSIQTATLPRHANFGPSFTGFSNSFHGAPSPAHSNGMPSPAHSPTSDVFPMSTAYASPYPADHRQALLSNHHRSHSDISGLTLKGLSAVHMDTDYSSYLPGHQRSRTTLDGTSQVPQFHHSSNTSSLPVSPISLGQIPELPFLRSISHGHIPSLNLGYEHFGQADEHVEKRPSSTGIVNERFTPLGYNKDDEVGNIGQNGPY